MRIIKRLQHFFIDTREMLHTPRYLWSFASALFLLVLVVALPLWRIVPIGVTRQYIPLHYNIYFGVDRFGSWKQIFVIPVLGLVLLLINLFFQTIVFRHQKLLATFLAISSIFIELIFLISMILIVLLNLSYAL